MTREGGQKGARFSETREGGQQRARFSDMSRADAWLLGSSKLRNEQGGQQGARGYKGGVIFHASHAAAPRPTDMHGAWVHGALPLTGTVVLVACIRPPHRHA